MSNSPHGKTNQKSLSRLGLVEIIGEMTDIEVEMDWDHEEGSFSQSVEIASSHYSVIADISISGTKLKTYAATLDIPEECEVQINPPEVGQVVVFDVEGEEVHITDKQYKSLVYNIKENIHGLDR